MKKGDIIEGVITDYSFPNRGSFAAEDRKVIVKNAFPGQKVRCRIVKKRSSHYEAVTMDVLEESPMETEKPVCHHFFECGGCTYQTMKYETQLKLKSDMIEKLLREVVEDLPWEGIVASPSQYGYRNKMEFTFGDQEKDGPMTLGLHRMNSNYDILPINGCAIVRKAWNEILEYTQKFYRNKKVSFYHKMSHEGILRFLVVRQSYHDGGILVNLVTTTKRQLPDGKNGVVEDAEKVEFNKNEILQELCLDEYVEGLKKLEKEGKFDSLHSHSHLAGVLLTENNSLSDAVKCDSIKKIYGDDFLIEEVLGLKFKISPFSFFQTNTKGCEVLYSKVREYVLSVYEDDEAAVKGETKDIKAGIIYDLYSGTGTIAQLMAPIASKVYGIEIVEEAVEAARENAKLNKLKNCEFIAGDVLAKLDEIEEKPDFIILDPPREGCTPKALEKIIDYGVKNMVYISCKPTSLQRDLITLQESGYKVVRACCIDEFPNTQHVETVVLLSRID